MTKERLEEIRGMLARWDGEPIYSEEHKTSTPPALIGQVQTFETYHQILRELDVVLRFGDEAAKALAAKAGAIGEKTRAQMGWGGYCEMIAEMLPAAAQIIERIEAEEAKRTDDERKAAEEAARQLQLGAGKGKGNAPAV